MTTLLAQIEALARALDFDRVAILPAGPLQGQQALRAWLAEGRHAQMDYMTQHQALRLDPRQLEPGSLSVIVVLKNYFQPLDLLPGGVRLARYAQHLDYHDVLRERLRLLAQQIEALLGSPVRARPATDSAPLLERSLAQAAGLGWRGKNTMLIHPQLGSFFLLAELLVDHPLEPSAYEPVPDRCGRCSRCLDVCPTGALVSPGVLDARRCISYLTIEHRGPIPYELRPLILDYMFGCDLCQDVCPWNVRRATPTEDLAFKTRQDYMSLTPEAILCMDQDAFSRTFARSAIKRAKRRGLLRNAAVVLGNRGDPGALDLLRERLVQEPEPLVRGHIAWAIGRLGGAQDMTFLQARLALEPDELVLQELALAIAMLHANALPPEAWPLGGIWPCDF